MRPLILIFLIPKDFPIFRNTFNIPDFRTENSKHPGNTIPIIHTLQIRHHTEQIRKPKIRIIHTILTHIRIRTTAEVAPRKIQVKKVTILIHIIHDQQEIRKPPLTHHVREAQILVQSQPAMMPRTRTQHFHQVHIQPTTLKKQAALEPNMYHKQEPKQKRKCG